MNIETKFILHTDIIIKLIKENNLIEAREVLDTKLNPLLNTLNPTKDSDFYDIQEMLSDLVNEIPSVELRDVEKEYSKLKKEKGCTF